MKTLCVCGHAKSQHPNGVCDYKGYACQCTGYQRRPKVALHRRDTVLLHESEYPSAEAVQILTEQIHLIAGDYGVAVANQKIAQYDLDTKFGIKPLK